jgi:hypothetical protein
MLNFIYWLYRHASTIVYSCIALLQLLERWQHQSRKLWIPHCMSPPPPQSQIRRMLSPPPPFPSHNIIF